jgi:hypothetical protein
MTVLLSAWGMQEASQQLSEKELQLPLSFGRQPSPG